MYLSTGRSSYFQDILQVEIENEGLQSSKVSSFEKRIKSRGRMSMIVACRIVYDPNALIQPNTPMTSTAYRMQHRVYSNRVTCSLLDTVLGILK